MLVQSGPVFNKLHDLSDEDKEAQVQLVQKRYQASLKFMNNLYPQMIAAYKKYRSIAEPLRDELGREVTGEPNLYVPYPWAIVESELPRLAGKLPRIRVFPRKEVDEEKIDLRQDYLYYVFDRMNFLETQTLWLRQYAIYGWSPLYHYWRQEQSNILSKEQNPQTGEWSLVKKPFMKYDDFWCRVVDVFDSFMQPGVTRPEEGDWFIFREYVSKKDIERLVEAGTFYPEVTQKMEESHDTSSAEDSGRTDRDSLIGQIRDISPEHYGKYELRYCLEDDKITITLNQSILCAVSDNPDPLQEKPIINCNLMPMVNEPLGISTIESLAGLPDKLNALTNARLKNMSLMLGKVFLANRNANVDWDNFVMDSGNIIFTDDLSNTMEEFEFKDQGVAAEREILTTKEELQFVSGVSDYIVGVKSGSRLSDTATGVSTIVREANARYALKQASYESGSLRKLVIKADAYSRLYVTDEKRIHVLGPTGLKATTITPEDVCWEADLVIEPGSVAPLDQATRREGLTALLDRVMKLPNVVDIGKYVQQVLESYDFRNADELVLKKQDLTGVHNEVALAEAENMALSMGDDVPLVGDDMVHISVHQNADASRLPPDFKAKLQLHIQAHGQKVMKLQQAAMMLQQQQAMAMGGGMNGGQNIPGRPAPGGAPGQPQGPPGMGGPPGMAAPQGIPAG